MHLFASALHHLLTLELLLGLLLALLGLVEVGRLGHHRLLLAHEYLDVTRARLVRYLHDDK